MPELHGYGVEAAAQYQLQARLLDYLKTKEEQHKIPIHLHFNGGTSVALREDQADVENPIIRIYDFATPGELLNLQTREQIFFRDMREGTASRLHPMGLVRRHAIRHPAAGYEKMIAGKEVDGCEWLGVYDYLTMWYKFGLINVGRSWASTVDSAVTMNDKFDAVLGQFIDQVVDQDFLKKIKRDRLAGTKKAFMEYSADATASEVVSIRTQIASVEAQMAQLNQQQQSHALNLMRQNRRLDAAEKAKASDDEVFEQNFDQLIENVKLDKIDYEASQGKLMLTTKLLYLHSPNKQERTPLGVMRIDFYPIDRRVLIFNLTNRRGDRQHPHVPSDGNPCWGGIETVVRNFLTHGELMAFVELALDFLETYNPEDSWGRWASNWFGSQGDETQHLQADGRWLTKDEMAAQPVEDTTSDLSSMTTELEGAMSAEEVNA